MAVHNHNKRILIIGLASSVFVKDFISQYAHRGYTVDLISTGKADRLEAVDIQINIGPVANSLFGKIGRHIKIIRDTKSAISKLPDGYEAAVIHGINIFLAPSMKMLKQKARRVVAVVWGSDYYRSTRAQDILKIKIYRNADSIVFTNPKTLEDFSKKNPHILADKLRIARFGLPVLDEIDKLKAHTFGRTDLPYDFFGLPDDKIIVLAGYSGSLAHRQDLIIAALAGLKPAIRNLIHLVFPVGYGSPEVKKAIEEKLTQAQAANYSILTDFYSFQDAAKLRCITDILINIQSSDQFSGSMQETLYAGGYVIAGAWLPYQEIIDAGAKIKLVEKPEGIARALTELIEAHCCKETKPTAGVKQYIKNASSWNVTIKQWDSAIFADSTSRAP
ncbi:hypothetical protein KVP10_09305 [Candidimonas humi]|uniref:Glycosyltransferase n=1 Tax=Candidimonas humi TaxID=683355 RepID=A0ABV8NU63_9BURK|nr:glycosyltransferase [Candidimonas humi]MBV6305084.1 hypothetical protein [Candidimonas humi]